MSVHRYHPDVHEYGLQGGCDRCEELAMHPEQLDQSMRERLRSARIITTLDRIAADNLRAAFRLSTETR